MERINCTSKRWGVTSKAAMLLNEEKIGATNVNTNRIFKKLMLSKVANTFLH